MSVPTWDDCIAAGMSQSEAGKARGVTRAAACQWARRKGVRFVSKKGQGGGNRARLRHPHLRHLSDERRAEYEHIRRWKHVSAAEALAMVAQ